MRGRTFIGKEKANSGFLLMGLTLVFLWILGGCAQPGTPEGGPVDKQGPRVVATYPEVGSVNFREGKVTATFDEFIKLPAYEKEVLISPLLPTRPKVRLNGKKLIIKFSEPLDLGVTYVVTLIDVQDFNASNRMETPFQLAFSTGATIDSMEIEGQIETVLGEPAEEVTVLLFDADSVTPATLADKRPAYITRSSKDGSFNLSYLRPGPFAIYGIRDGNGSRTYTPPNEAIALALDPEIVFDTGRIRSVRLILSTPDQQAPLVNNVQWLTDSSLVVGFTEGIVAEGLQVSMSDTSFGDFQYQQDWVSLVNEIAIPTTRLRDSLSLLGLTGLRDSLGNLADTSLLLRPRRARLPEGGLLAPPQLDPFGPSYGWVMPFRLPPGGDSMIVLRDSGARAVPSHLEIEGLYLSLFPDTAMIPGISYNLEMPGRWWGYPDSVFSFGVKAFDPESYGNLQGRFALYDTSGYQGPYLYQLIGSGIYSFTDTLFDLKYLKPGSYESRVILDADSNGVWTPGSLVPYRLPEKILKGESVSVRANWEFADYTIRVGVLPVDTDSTSEAASEGLQEGSGKP